MVDGGKAADKGEDRQVRPAPDQESGQKRREDRKGQGYVPVDHDAGEHSAHRKGDGVIAGFRRYGRKSPVDGGREEDAQLCEEALHKDRHRQKEQVLVYVVAFLKPVFREIVESGRKEHDDDHHPEEDPEERQVVPAGPLVETLQHVQGGEADLFPFADDDFVVLHLEIDGFDTVQDAHPELFGGVLVEYEVGLDQFRRQHDGG
ncbi:MAG: hypothetical protein CSYNP_04510 [Syntrophus sp. SKADARSKE-3]|nr:hypothetical protein [Syntrophus sp. SKADARSKE-3]